MTKEQHIGDKIHRFIDHLPRDADDTLIILKGHLLIEEILRKLLFFALRNDEPIKEAKLSSFQCTCLCEAYYKENTYEWVWKAIKKLNTLRNRIAHNVVPVGVDDSKRNFIDFVCEASGRENEIKVALPGRELEFSISEIYQIVAVLWHKKLHGHNLAV